MKPDELAVVLFVPLAQARISFFEKQCLNTTFLNEHFKEEREKLYKDLRKLAARAFAARDAFLEVEKSGGRFDE